MTDKNSIYSFVRARELSLGLTLGDQLGAHDPSLESHFWRSLFKRRRIHKKPNSKFHLRH